MNDFLVNCCMVWGPYGSSAVAYTQRPKQRCLEKFQPHAVSQMDMNKKTKQKTGKIDFLVGGFNPSEKY